MLMYNTIDGIIYSIVPFSNGYNINGKWNSIGSYLEHNVLDNEEVVFFNKKIQMQSDYFESLELDNQIINSDKKYVKL